MTISSDLRLSYKIGDKVKIRVVDANKELRKISFELVEEEVND